MELQFHENIRKLVSAAKKLKVNEVVFMVDAESYWGLWHLYMHSEENKIDVKDVLFEEIDWHNEFTRAGHVCSDDDLNEATKIGYQWTFSQFKRYKNSGITFTLVHNGSGASFDLIQENG